MIVSSHSNLWIKIVGPFSRFLDNERKLSTAAASLQNWFIIDDQSGIKVMGCVLELIAPLIILKVLAPLNKL